ncbi:MAG: hypothetical protein GXO99_06070 [Nitrospirae bacterium]|nr:hypothetical protein [Nitrospirota bacterium]
MKEKKATAVALLSGGLDSTLAILVLLKQNIEVKAITFLTQFGCDISDRSSCSRNPFPAAEKYGFEVKLSHLADKFLEIVKNPKYGHGKNMNPCIDCRILMLKEAKVYMDLIGADFLVTGEVLGQRPMSQRRECFPMIDREAGVEGLVLRPLSAKLLPPTIPEQKGLVDREKLYGFKGRTRKPQMALAEELGLVDYPSPAGGCLLTEPIYSVRLKDLLEHNPDPSYNDIHLLRVGRHFRLSPEAKVIIGRNKEENDQLKTLVEDGDLMMRVDGVGSPITVMRGTPGSDEIRLAASMTARYSDAKRQPQVTVTVFNKEGLLYKIDVQPAEDALLDRYRIHYEPRKKKKRKRAAVKI